MKSLDLFSGIGGFAVASEWLGIETSQFVEINPYCQQVLNRHFPEVPIHDDITTYNPEPNQFNIVIGGSPCQDLSVAGKQKGIIDGEKSSLWFEQLRIYRESKATFLVWENVAGAIRNGFRELLRSLAECGYDAEWQTISASSVGLPHRRDRIFLIAYPTGLFKREPVLWSEQLRSQIVQASTYSNGKRRFCLQNENRINSEDFCQKDSLSSCDRFNSLPLEALPKSYFLRVDDGICGKLDKTTLNEFASRIHALGNAVTPQQAMIPLMRVLYLNSLL